MTTTPDPAAVRAAIAAIRERAEAATPDIGEVGTPDRRQILDLRHFRDADEELVVHARADVLALVAVAAAVAGLVARRGAGWWHMHERGDAWCFCCREEIDLYTADWAEFQHAADCPALALDDALARLAGEVGDG